MIPELRLILAAAFACGYAVTSLHDYHMFQLNSYKPGVHLRWLGRNFARYLYHHAAALPVLLISFFTPSAPVLIAQILLYAIQFYWNMPRKAKKPLVFTNRVKRMLATNAVVTAAMLVLSFSAGYEWQALAQALWLLSSPFVMLLSNALNSPVERSINRWYVEDAGRIIRSRPDLVVIGVTGSYGKTSTKYFLHRLLSPRFNVLMTPENYNTTLGVVKTVRTQLRPIHEIFICEMGARQVGDIKEICDIVKPRYGVITSIGPQHLESFGSIENIISTKFELADALPEDGVLFLNLDNEYIRNKTCEQRLVSYCVSCGDADYRASELAVSSFGSSFTVSFPDGHLRRFETKLLGRHNVTNIVAAAAVADHLGVSPEDISISVRRLDGVPHRLQLINRHDIIIVDDAYNSNESGALAALEALGMFDGFKILVTPGMVELGNEQDRYNRTFGRQAAGICDYVVLVGEKGTRSLLAGLKGESYPDEKIFIADDIGPAFEKIYALRASGRKVVLIENDLPDNY
jgi:UDP-N-acetylmuramoyl-tripeptide--D-alanyl-D-alanine ligase